MKFISASDIGLVRNENQDNVYVTEIDGGIFAILCDGMGGESSGSDASRIAVEAMLSTFNNMYDEEGENPNIRNILISAASSANTAVYEESCTSPDKRGMGTTCVSAFVSDDIIHIVNIGDSRAYLYTKESLVKITNDHTLVNMLLTQGEITKEEAEVHPYRNMLIKAVGVEKNVFPDYFKIENSNNKDFILLLCSDGLSGYCSEKEIEEILKNTSFESIADELVKLANSKGGSDNVTVAVIG